MKREIKKEISIVDLEKLGVDRRKLGSVFNTKGCILKSKLL